MSGEKDISRPLGTPGRARATLAQLRANAISFTKFGDTITLVTRMGEQQIWTRVPGTGRGEASLFEKEVE